MMPFNLFPSAAIGDKLLIAADPILLFLTALAGAAMVLWSIWLSHRPQPVPNETAWRVNEGARRGPYRHRRGKR